MNTYVIVHLSDLSINTYYKADEVNYRIFGGKNGSPETSIHLRLPEELAFDIITPNKDPGTGEITLQADPQKVQANIATAWVALRTERNTKLTACDWTQFRDSPLTIDKQDLWVNYRQALRDLPSNTTDPTNVSWPAPPS
jgi:hypothetical protein